MKRANGTGSAYKLSGKRRNPWVAMVSEVNDKDEQVKKIIGYCKTKTKATELLDAYNVGAYAPPEKITLKEVYDEWHEQKNMSKSAKEGYEMGWNYIKDYGHLKFSDIRAAHLQKTIDKAEDKSHSTVSKIRTLWSQLYKHAMKNDIATRDYSKYIDMPKNHKKTKVRFTDIEIKRLFELAEKEIYITPILIMIYTGLRIGELMQLTKFNIDLDQMIITGGIKTDAGRDRIIPIHPKIQPYIIKWYDMGGETLITGRSGDPLSAHNYREKYYKPLRDEYGFRKILTPHCTRHTFASRLSASGVDTMYIQKLIGHADYATTANIYTHPEIVELTMAINKLK